MIWSCPNPITPDLASSASCSAQTGLDLRWSYAASSRFVLDRFRIREEPDDLNEVGGVNTYAGFSEVLWFGNCSQVCRLRPRRQAVRTAWNGPANTNIDLLNLDSSGFDTLSVRFASSPHAGPLDPGVSEHDFTLRISDTEGESAEVSLTSVGRLAHGYPRANSALVHEVLSTVRVPLATFVAENPELDLSQLQAVEFVFPGNGSSMGGVWLADLELVSDDSGSGCVPAGCEAAASVNIPYSQDGSIDTCVFFDDPSSFLNSWNMSVVEINGVEVTNTYVSSTSFPETCNDGYYLRAVGSFPWSHVEAM